MQNSKYYFYSLLLHVSIGLLFVLGYDFISPPPVLENSIKQDIISAVVLGDTPKSKILPKPTPPQPVMKETKLPDTTAKSQPSMKKKIVALTPKPMTKPKINEDLIAKELLKDLQKHKTKVVVKKTPTPFEKTLHEQAEKTLRQHLLEENIKLQNRIQRETAGIVDKYKALILQSIGDHWIIPPQADRKLYCELLIRLAPGGAVLNVHVTKGSGDAALDNSARAAVLKASPLPVPVNAEAFKAFKEFVLKVKPENILAADSA